VSPAPDLDADPDPVVVDHPVLDNPVWHSLVGHHRDLAVGTGRFRRYRPDVSVFAAVSSWDDPDVWDEVAAVAGPSAELAFTGAPVSPPDGWRVVWGDVGVQLVDGPRVRPARDPEVVELGADDVPQMLDLVARTAPGPFLPGTRLLGRYVGVRHAGRLVAMAGERNRPDGWTEISAVCTDPEHTGRGLASRLTLDVAAGIHERGERALLHAKETNVRAIGLYEHLGFVRRRRTPFTAVRTPEVPS
jgi:ribosomal protein S18 acetylase RimI-like enzyme